MKLGLALAGGGIRGVAHAGVLKALEENNIKIDIIGGTSSGSMIACLYAMGYSPYYIYNLIKRYSKEIAGINSKFIISGIGNIVNNEIYTTKRGLAIEKIFNNLATRRGFKNVCDIDFPLVIPTVDISRSKEYIFTNNIPSNVFNSDKYITNSSIGKAVRASSSFPAFFSPCNYNDCIFMDGAVMNNLPVEEVKLQGADKIIAVKFDSEKIDKTSNTMDIIMKTLDIMGSKISEKNLDMADLVLNVYSDKVGLLDTKKLDSCFEYGYQCVVDNIDKIKELCNK